MSARIGRLHKVGVVWTWPRQQQKEEAVSVSVQHAGTNTIGERQTGDWWYNSVNANEVKVSRAHAAPHGECDNSSNALKLLANQQKDGDSPIQSIAKRHHGWAKELR